MDNVEGLEGLRNWENYQYFGWNFLRCESTERGGNATDSARKSRVWSLPDIRQESRRAIGSSFYPSRIAVPECP
jgi:hypothetical protein